MHAKLRFHLIVVHSLLLFAVGNYADELFVYQYKLPIGSYVNDVKSSIRQGAQAVGWEISSETPGLINLLLVHQKTNSELKANVHYDNDHVWLELVSDRSLACQENNSSACAVDSELKDRWLINLRRQIAHEFHVEAITDAGGTAAVTTKQKSYETIEQQLTSPSQYAITLAAKQIRSGKYSDPRVVDMAAERLWQLTDNYDPYYNDAITWLAIALGDTGNARYKNTLSQAISKPLNSRVIKDIKNALKALPDIETDSYQTGMVVLPEYSSTFIEDLKSKDPHQLIYIANCLTGTGELSQETTDMIATRIPEIMRDSNRYMVKATILLFGLVVDANNPKYRQLYETLSQHQANKKLAKMARNAIDELGSAG